MNTRGPKVTIPKLLGLYIGDDLVDYGVPSKWEDYEAQGYIIRVLTKRKPLATRIFREFGEVWNSLNDTKKKQAISYFQHELPYSIPTTDQKLKMLRKLFDF